MKPKASWFLVALVNVLLPIGILIFAKGFFPYKPFLPGLAVRDAEDVVTAPFDKVIFMVVDALRSDFVYSEFSSFKFTQSLISTGTAIPFTAYASSPTITMPRVKALTTGSIPSFLDVILNFAESDTSSTLATQDTWLAQLKASGRGLVMFGDDTWLKLFPDFFLRADGTSSFFVADFTEVDNNVTRHLEDELQQKDWDGMILHYLGLDHIGHKSGPKSQNMAPKQAEMDGIVQRLYSAVETIPELESTLIVLAGDHGMNDAGNHGGSGAGETSPALVLLSPKFKRISNGVKCPAELREEFDYYTKVEQSDIVPTLAGLVGTAIPRNNLGVFIKSFLGLWDEASRKKLMEGNAKQLYEIANARYSDFDKRGPFNVDCNSHDSEADTLACLWKEAKEGFDSSDISPEEAVKRAYKFSEKCQDYLSSTATNYNLTLMGLGTALIFVAFVASAVYLAPILNESHAASASFVFITILYGITMFASSFVEEEHHFWYWTASAWAVVLLIKERRAGATGIDILVFLLILRLTRRWNQTGQKHAGASDIVKSYLTPHPALLWVFILATYCDLIGRMSRKIFHRAGHEIASIMSIAIIATAVAFKVSFAKQEAPELLPQWLGKILDATKDISLVNQARTVFSGLGITLAFTILVDRRYSRTKPSFPRTAHVLNDLLTVLLATQSRFTNIPLLFLFHIQTLILTSTRALTPTDITLTSLLLQRTSFFAFAGTNAISSVDLSSAYNGVSGYNVLIVGLLTFISNWIGPIFWSSASFLLLAKRAEKAALSRVNYKAGQKKSEAEMGKINEVVEEAKTEAFLRNVLMMTVFEAGSVVAVMVACTVLRSHLFIWTVFSPKYLYCMAWTVGMHLGITLVGGAVWRWGSR